MSRRVVEVRPANLNDLDLFGFELMPVRLRAWTGFIDGEPVAIGGYWYSPSGGTVAFLNCENKARELAPVALFKTALRVIEDAKARGIVSLIARPSADIPSAERFLRRLKFIPVGNDGGTTIYEAKL